MTSKTKQLRLRSFYVKFTKMKIILAPAKSLDFQSLALTKIYTQANFLDDSLELIHQLQLFSPAQISTLMNLSDKLSKLNYQRFQDWSLPLTTATAKQCLFAFTGDAYQGLEAKTMSNEALNFAQQHLRILSGLYGVLKPLDLMLPYRLEMSTKLNTLRGNNLYDFWGVKLTNFLNAELEQEHNPTLINLASKEYAKSVNLKNIKANVVTPIFKDKRNCQYKIISFFAKKSRGLMSRYIIDNRLTQVEAIKDFTGGNYRYNSDLSAGSEWVFTRNP